MFGQVYPKALQITRRDRKRAFVFIVTYGRSGSTLLQQLVGSNCGYLIRGENNNALFYLYKSYQKLVSASKNFLTHDTQSISHPWYGLCFFNQTDYARALANLFVQQVIKPSQQHKVIGFKEVRYIEHLDELESYLDFLLTAFFPCKFVFNVRRAEDVAASQAQTQWWPMNKEETVALIERCDAIFRTYTERNKEKCYIVEYDSYIKNPQALRGMYDFLGEPFDIEKVSSILKR